MKVSDAAVELGVSARRIRALIASGRLAALKVGREWEITDLGHGARGRRALSMRSREILARALHDRSLRGLVGQDRARTAARLRELRASPDAAQLLIDWWGASPPSTVGYVESLVDLALAGNRAEVDEAVHRRRREYLRRPDDLADVVATERAIRGLSRSRLADVAGVTVDDIRRIERSEALESSTTARRVLRAIDVEPSALPDVVAA